MLNLDVINDMPASSLRDLLKMAMGENAHLREMLRVGSHALRSYQYGNGSTELAESTADAIDAELAKAKE